MIVTFLTDFGLQDDFVGTCHGVIRKIAPDADVIDITHGVDPQQILQGAMILANTLPYMPVGVHLAVVDPGVGTDRKALVLRGADGRYYVGPDNGLLIPAAERLGGISDAWELVSREYRLEPVSATFHGRDIFSPAAAYLAAGVDPAAFGPSLDVGGLVRLPVPEPELHGEVILAHVIVVDRFGNIQLNLTADHLEQAGIEAGTQIELEIQLQRYYGAAARTFADVRLGDIVLYEDAYGNVAVAINGGNVAEMLSAHPGDEVRIRVRVARD